MSIHKQQECIPVGCVSSDAVAVLGAGGSVCLWPQSGVHTPGRHPLPLWTEFLAHACEKIRSTFPQLLLWMVKIYNCTKRIVHLFLMLSHRWRGGSCTHWCIYYRGGSRIPHMRGRQPSGGGTNIYKFARYSHKLHEIKKILVRGGGG